MSRNRWLARLGTDRRGVSETLGYILVFSIIITTITTASVFGFTGLEDRQEAEAVTNVERAFDVLSDNFGDISRYEDPSRATEIRLAGGTVGVGDPVTITLGQWDAENGSFVTTDQTNTTFRPLEFQSDGGDVIYEGGVVFRADDSRSIARSSTPIVEGEETAVISPVHTTLGSGPTAVGGERTILVVGEHRSNTVPLANRTVEGDDLRLRIESPRADGWARQFEHEGYESAIPSTDVVVVALPVGRARLSITRIAVQFD